MVLPLAVVFRFDSNYYMEEIDGKVFNTVVEATHIT